MSIGSTIIGAAPIAAPIASGSTSIHLQESVTITPVMLDTLINGLLETMTLTLSESSTVQVLEQLADGATLADAIKLVFKVFAAESVTMTVTDAAFATTVAKAVEALTITGLALSPIQAIYQIAAGMTVNDTLMAGFWPTASESVTITDTISDLFNANVEAVESALMTAGAIPVMMVVVTAAETVSLGTTLADALVAFESLSESVEIAVQVIIDDRIYWAYVLNTESKAASNYINFPYNSFALIDGKYYGARDNGIYLLEGADDAGTQIDAHIRSGLLDFDSTYLKRLKYAYIGYTTDGQVLLKIIDTADGVKTERHYELVQQTADTYREARRKLGGGVKSRYWGFELANIDGADFDLESIQFMPIMLTRRVNSG